MMQRLFPLFLITALLLYSCQKDPVVKFQPDVVTDGHITDTLLNSEDSIHLTGYATDKDGDVVAYLWSLVSGPTVPQIITPGMPQTDITMVNSGTYIFQLMATDNEGYTGVAFDTIEVIVKQKTIDSLVLQPSGNNSEVLFFGNTYGLDQTDPHSIELVAGAWTYNSVPSIYHSALEFDLSSIPSSAFIAGAYLSLYSNPTPLNGNHVDANFGNDNIMLIQRITSSWSSSTVNYLNQPTSTNEDEVVIPKTSQSFLDLKDINVTSLVSKMIAQSANYGFFLKLQNEVYYNDRDFCSSNWPDASKRPKLVVKYIK